MRVVIHDYCGHPFQIQLSRELARRGADVLHLHCPSYTSGKGATERLPTDPASFHISGVHLDEDFAKHNPRKRLLQELQYGRRLVRQAAEFTPDVVVSANTPLFAQRRLLTHCRRTGVRFVHWHQDIISLAMRHELDRRLPLVGGRLGGLIVALERWIVRQSDAVVVISDGFIPTLRSWGVGLDKVEVIENWAPLAELPMRNRRNHWSAQHGLDERTVILYAGTLGLKHNPGLLLELAKRFADRPEVAVVVVSEGVGADWLVDQTTQEGLQNLVVLPFQPYEELPDVLATGDVLVVILEPQAGVFSVPSKVLSYHCAGRPLLGAMPAENLAAETVARSGSGLVVDPSDRDAFANAAQRLIDDDQFRSHVGAAARRYAEATFDIERIADRFSDVLLHAPAMQPAMKA